MPPDITITQPNAICVGDSFDLSTLTIVDANEVTPGDTNYTYHSGTPARGGVTAPGNELASSTVSPTMTTIYYVLATSADGCVQEEPVTITVTPSNTAGAPSATPKLVYQYSLNRHYHCNNRSNWNWKQRLDYQRE